MFVIAVHYDGDLELEFESYENRDYADAAFKTKEVLWPSSIRFVALFETLETDPRAAIESVTNYGQGVTLIKSFPHAVRGDATTRFNFR